MARWRGRNFPASGSGDRDKIGGSEALQWILGKAPTRDAVLGMRFYSHADLNPALDVATATDRVGASDSMLAGIVVGLCRGLPLHEAGRFGMAAGAAALLGAGTELCRRVDVERLYQPVSGTDSPVDQCESVRP